MKIDLEGRVALVTGGARGIGAAASVALAGAGARVVIWDRADAAETVAAIAGAGGEASAMLVDVAAPEEVSDAVRHLVEDCGRIDVLINNAGIVRDAQLVKMTPDDFASVVAVNLDGVFQCTRCVVPHMIAQGYGRIITASSVVALYGNFGQTNYAATKAGVIGMTRVWARELGKHGITANVVAPGFIDTEMARGIPEKVLRMMVERTPVGRLGRPEDVAHGYVFLASEQASFVNGAVLSVDGGLVPGT